MTQALRELLGFERPLQVADIGAAYINEVPVYRSLIDRGLAEFNAFEADVRQHAALSAAYGGNLRLFPHIIGDGSIQDLHLAAPESGMTSLLKPSPHHLAFFNGFEMFGTIYSVEQVQTTRLDDVPGLPDLDFLKMDIQGGELQALKGGVDRLRHCAMIQLEVTFVPLYENQPTIADIDYWMRSHGFVPHCFAAMKPWSVAPVVRDNNFRVPFNQIMEADLVYMKDPIRPGALNPEIMKAIILIAHYCYQSVDLAGRLTMQLAQQGVIAPDAFDRYMELARTGG